jgi:hypothetical protein
VGVCGAALTTPLSHPCAQNSPVVTSTRSGTRPPAQVPVPWATLAAPAHGYRGRFAESDKHLGKVHRPRVSDGAGSMINVTCGAGGTDPAGRECRPVGPRPGPLSPDPAELLRGHCTRQARTGGKVGAHGRGAGQGGNGTRGSGACGNGTRGSGACGNGTQGGSGACGKRDPRMGPLPAGWCLMRGLPN